MSGHDVVNRLQFSRHLASERDPGPPGADLADEHVIQAHHPEHGHVGELAIRAEEHGGRPAGHVDDVWVRDDLQRRGVGTALWQHAQQLAEQGVIPRPQHSPNQSEAGRAWAKRVGQ